MRFRKSVRFNSRVILLMFVMGLVFDQAAAFDAMYTRSLARYLEMGRQAREWQEQQPQTDDTHQAEPTTTARMNGRKYEKQQDGRESWRQFD